MVPLACRIPHRLLIVATLFCRIALLIEHARGDIASLPLIRTPRVIFALSVLSPHLFYLLAIVCSAYARR